ncbi:MAG: VIT domain-containing protein [Gemmatimonadaceae bacterium]
MLRTSSWALALGLAAAAASPAGSQGRVIPRPCVGPLPTPRPPCPPNAECIAPQFRCGPFPIERTFSEVQAHLDGRVVRYEITEKFVNRGGGLGEADYIFPLPMGAAFEDLRLEINGELVAGETLAADRARGIYEEIVRRQRDPALVEWMGHGLLRARIFPLNPGEEKKVVVRLRTLVRREGAALRVDYTRGSDPSGAAGLANIAVARGGERPDEERAAGWSRFTLTLPRGAQLGDPYSPTHALRERERAGMREVSASGTAPTITILLPLRHPNEASVTVVSHAPDRADGYAADGYALINISPPPARMRPLARDVTFVLDVSGSMRGRKLEQAKAAGRALLESLAGGDRFRVIDFATDVNSFRNGFVAAGGDNVREARRYIDNLRAEGSTNISAALEEALDVAAARERVPIVVFLTDGEPTAGERDPDAIAAMAARLRNNARVFSVGVGAEVHAGLIEQLALEGRGTAHFVSATESVEHAVSLLAQRLRSPVLGNVRVHADGVRLAHLLPVLPSDLFAGQDLVLLARYSGSGNARLEVTADGPNGALSWSRDVQFAERERGNAFVARLWAAQRLGWLAAEKRKRGGSAELDAEIKSLGERFGIPTEFSSYLVLEPGMQVAQDMRRDLRAPQPATVEGAERSGQATGAVARPFASGSVRLEQLVVTGNAAREQEFAAAKRAASQRDTRSLATLDSAGAVDEGRSATRRVEHRIFRLVDGVWTDVNYAANMRTVRVKAFSPLYFELVQRLSGLGAVVALGERLVVAGKTVAIELTPAGAERLSEGELLAVARDW